MDMLKEYCIRNTVGHSRLQPSLFKQRQKADPTQIMRMIFQVCLIAVGISFASSISVAEQEKHPDFIEHQLDTYINEVIKSWHVPGLAIAVVKNGKLHLARGYGTKALEQKTQVNEHTLFTLGSTTKAFTATAIATLAFQQGFSLDDPINRILPDFKLSVPEATNRTSMQDLLSHRSGLGTYQGDFMFFDSTLDKTEMYAALGKLKLTNEFKTYGYTNVGYFLLGEAIASASGKSYETYLKETLFTPLNMTRTTITPSIPKHEKNKAGAHTLKDNEAVAREVGDITNMVAAGGIATSAHDLGNWMIAQLQDGKFSASSDTDIKQVIPPEVIAMLRKPQILIGRSKPPYTIFNKSNFETYASGWYNIDYEGLEVITHNGGSYGYSSSITLIPELGLGIAILTNSDSHLLFETLKLEIMDAYLGLPFRDYSAIAHGFFNAQVTRETAKLNEMIQLVQAAADPTLPLELYQGVYKNDAYGEIQITENNGHLEMSFQHHPTLKGVLKFIKEGKFLSQFNQSIYGASLIPFTIEDGSIISMTFSVDDNVEPNVYLFKKIK